MKQNITKIPVRLMTTNKIFELILMPTEQCNFRCTYCYEDFTIGRMRQDVIDGVKNLILKRAKDLDLLKISWFGGEPLSAKSVVYDIANYAQSLASTYQFTVKSSMTTNAYHLSTTVMEKLLRLGVNTFQISLDGVKEYHDQTRLRINGSGSFDQIWHNLVMLANSNLEFTIVLRIHLTKDNLDSVPQLIRKLNRLAANDNRFQVFLKAVENLGGDGVKNVNRLPRQDQANVIAKLNAMLDAPLLNTENNHQPAPCYASYLNSLVVRADGRIAKCTVALSDERNVVGLLAKNGEISFNNTKLNLWLKGLFADDAAYMTCPYHKIVRQDNEKQTSSSLSD